MYEINVYFCRKIKQIAKKRCRVMRNKVVLLMRNIWWFSAEKFLLLRFD